MRRTVLLGVLVAVGALSIGLAAMPELTLTAGQQPPSAPRVIDIVKLKDNLYVIIA